MPEADASSYAVESSLLYFEASAKNNVNVTNIFDDVADRLPKAAALQQPAGGAGGGGIQLGEQPAPAGARRSACC